MQTMKQKGFTLIELLVVIVIIGILATISVATFSGYFAKARDSERQAAVRNTATLLKTARAVDSIVGFDIITDNDDGTSTLEQSVSGVSDPITIAALFTAEGGFSVPAATTAGFTYHYYSSDNNNFAVFTCSEDSNTLIIDGTQPAIDVVEGANGATCDASGVTLGTALADADRSDITN